MTRSRRDAPAPAPRPQVHPAHPELARFLGERGAGRRAWRALELTGPARSLARTPVPESPASPGDAIAPRPPAPRRRALPAEALLPARGPCVPAAAPARPPGAPAPGRQPRAGSARNSARPFCPGPAGPARPLQAPAPSLSSRPRPFCLARPGACPPLRHGPAVTRAPLVWPRPVPVLQAPPLYLVLPSTQRHLPRLRAGLRPAFTPPRDLGPASAGSPGPPPPTPLPSGSPRAASARSRGSRLGAGFGSRTSEPETPIFPHFWSPRRRLQPGVGCGCGRHPHTPHTTDAQ